MAGFNAVTDYVSYARVLLQDQVLPYRYPDPDLVSALNQAVTESARLRPDLWLGVATLPQYSANDNEAVAVPTIYQMAFVWYMVGITQLRDEEYTQDSRASLFLQEFTKMFVGGG